jgi:hypothetical protein
MEPKAYWREIYSKGGKTILWYEQDGELKYRHVVFDQPDKWYRHVYGWTNSSIHKID